MNDDLNFNSAQDSVTKPDCRNRQIAESGRIHVGNPTSSWIPDLILQREIGGTIYSVFGSYDGLDALSKKVLRIMENNLKNVEESE